MRRVFFVAGRMRAIDAFFLCADAARVLRIICSCAPSARLERPPPSSLAANPRRGEDVFIAPTSRVARRARRSCLSLLRVVAYCDRPLRHGVPVMVMRGNVTLPGECRKMGSAGAVSRESFLNVFKRFLTFFNRIYVFFNV